MNKVVYIEWEDSSSNSSSGWHSVEGWDRHSPIRCHSVGRITFEDDKQIILAAHWHDDRISPIEVQGVMRIPKSAVRKRLVLMVNSRKVKK